MAEAEVDVFLTDLIHCKEEIVRRLEEIERRVSERKQILLAEIARIPYIENDYSHANKLLFACE